MRDILLAERKMACYRICVLLPLIGILLSSNIPLAICASVSSTASTSEHTSIETKVTPRGDESQYDASTIAISVESLPPMKIVCYFTTESYYKISFSPDWIDPTLCTHIIYNFASMNDSYQIDFGDRHVDIEQDFYGKAIALKDKNPALKVLLSVGGWGDSTKKYSDMVSDPARIVTFVDSAVPFLKNYSFDGLDVAWEYPNCWQGNCGVNPDDVPNFVSLLTALRAAFNQENLLLTASVSPIREEIDAAYDVNSLNELLDFINVMSYDFHGGWEKTTGHHAQFLAPLNDIHSSLNVNRSANHWIYSGADRSKLILGIPSYGRTYTLSSLSNSGLNAPVLGPGEPGNSTQESGLFAFHEICDDYDSFEHYSDDRAGEYAVRGDLWVGYDSPKRAVKKARFIQKLGLGGAAYKHFYTDDYKGSCYGTTYPILRSIQYGLLPNKIQDFETEVKDLGEFMEKIQLSVLVADNQDKVDHEEMKNSDVSDSDVLLKMTATEISSKGVEEVKEIKINAGTLDIVGDNNGRILDMLHQGFATGGTYHFG